LTKYKAELNDLTLQRCDYEITPNLCIFKPASLPSGLMIAATLKAPSIALWEKHHDSDDFKLSLARYAEIAQIPIESLQTVKQVHSDRAIAYAGDVPQAPPPEADAVIVTSRHGYGGVFVADCLAVVLFSLKQQLCATVHAGWRGALQRIGGKTAIELCKLGAEPGDLAAVLAIGIGVESYRVGDELLPLFAEQGHDINDIFAEFPDGWHLDLRRTVASDLVGFGINPRHIYNSGLCSFTEHDLLWSYRRDGKQSLRNLVFCGWHGSNKQVR
jgi:polyphenol oxidase